MHSAIDLPKTKHCENAHTSFFFNGNIVLGLVHSPRGRQVPPLDSATSTCLTQSSRLYEKV
jgi:hypothetical protein